MFAGVVGRGIRIFPICSEPQSRGGRSRASGATPFTANWALASLRAATRLTRVLTPTPDLALGEERSIVAKPRELFFGRVLWLTVQHRCRAFFDPPYVWVPAWPQPTEKRSCHWDVLGGREPFSPVPFHRTSVRT